MTNKLKLCKKCKSKEWLYVYKDNYDKFGTGKFVVLCQNCGDFTEGNTEQEAVEAWNHRAEEK